MYEKSLLVNAKRESVRAKKASRSHFGNVRAESNEDRRRLSLSKFPGKSESLKARVCVVRSIAAITIIALSPFREVRAKNCLSLISKKASLGCVPPRPYLVPFPVLSPYFSASVPRLCALYRAVSARCQCWRNAPKLIPFYLRNVDKFADNGYSSKVEDRVPVYALFSDLDRALARINVNNRDKINTTLLSSRRTSRAR